MSSPEYPAARTPEQLRELDYEDVVHILNERWSDLEAIKANLPSLPLHVDEEIAQRLVNEAQAEIRRRDTGATRG